MWPMACVPESVLEPEGVFVSCDKSDELCFYGYKVILSFILGENSDQIYNQVNLV